MAYRRKHPPISRVSCTLRSAAGDDDDGITSPFPSPPPSSASTATPTLAAQAISASAAHRDAFSLSSAYGHAAAPSPRREPYRANQSPLPDSDNASYGYASMKNVYESKYGFWGTLARKAKAFIDDDDGVNKQHQASGMNPHQTVNQSSSHQFHTLYGSHDTNKTVETTRKSLEAVASSLNNISGTIKNALEEGLTIMENKTAGVINETRKLNIRRKGSDSNTQQSGGMIGRQTLPCVQTDYEIQLKASRDVANAMAAKAKLLLRELKTVKADLAFAKERCAQLEEENKMLRESQDKGDNPEDDDLIRLQLETLLAEKARLAHENSVYARENRFLREIVEYHQFTMQDVVYVDEGIEEVTEVHSNPIRSLTPIHLSESTSLSSPHPFTRTLSNPAFPHTQALQSPSVIPEDCPIVPMLPILSTLPDSSKRGESSLQ